MDWSELERRPGKNTSANQMKIQTQKVAVRKDQVRELPDETKIVIMDDSVQSPGSANRPLP